MRVSQSPARRRMSRGDNFRGDGLVTRIANALPQFTCRASARLSSKQSGPLPEECGWLQKVHLKFGGAQAKVCISSKADTRCRAKDSVEDENRLLLAVIESDRKAAVVKYSVSH